MDDIKIYEINGRFDSYLVDNESLLISIGDFLTEKLKNDFPEIKKEPKRDIFVIYVENEGSKDGVELGIIGQPGLGRGIYRKLRVSPYHMGDSEPNLEIYRKSLEILDEDKDIE